MSLHAADQNPRRSAASSLAKKSASNCEWRAGLGGSAAAPSMLARRSCFACSLACMRRSKASSMLFVRFSAEATARLIIASDGGSRATAGESAAPTHEVSEVDALSSGSADGLLVRDGEPFDFTKIFGAGGIGEARLGPQYYVSRRMWVAYKRLAPDVDLGNGVMGDFIMDAPLPATVQVRKGSVTLQDVMGA